MQQWSGFSVRNNYEYHSFRFSADGPGFKGFWSSVPVSRKILFGMSDVPGYPKSQKYSISDNAVSMLTFLL